MSRRRPWAAFFGAFGPFILGCAFVAGGFAAIILGYFGVSGTVYVGLQLPYLVSGVAVGLALVVLGSALVMTHALSRQSRLLRRLLAEVQSAEPLDSQGSQGLNGNGTVLVARGGKWFHRPGCLLLEGKSTRRMDSREAEAGGLTPCRLCDPVVPAEA